MGPGKGRGASWPPAGEQAVVETYHSRRTTRSAERAVQFECGEVEVEPEPVAGSVFVLIVEAATVIGHVGGSASSTARRAPSQDGLRTSRVLGRQGLRESLVQRVLRSCRGGQPLDAPAQGSRAIGPGWRGDEHTLASQDPVAPHSQK
eukprot:scaffold128265_cov35-Tisochrysis_lutea.AAC.2